MMQSSSWAECPELLQWIARHLDHTDIATCTLVNKHWNSQFGAALWHTLRLPYDVPLSLDDPLLRSALQRHGRHVRSLTLQNQPMLTLEGLEILRQCCQQLVELALNVSQPDDWVNVSVLLDHAPLNRLTLAISTAAMAEPIKVAEALKGATNLSALCLTQNAGPPSLILQLLDQCKHLHTLMVSVVTPGDLATRDWPSSSADHETTPASVAYALEDLSIGTCPWPLLQHLLTHSPRLLRIKLPKMDRSRLKSLQQAMRMTHSLSTPLPSSNIESTSRTSIQHLDLRHLSNWSDDELAKLLKACPPNTLRYLDLGGTQAGDKTCEAALKYQSGYLTTLDLRHAKGPLSSSAIQDLLSNCRRLHFFAAGNSQGTALLRAKQIVATPWCCLHLRILRVPIVDICRDTECRSHELCQLIQWQIYKQIGRLTRLEHLDLSNEQGTGKVKGGGGLQWTLEPESLEWTLERGMGQLEGLERLQSFDLRGTDHLLSEEEIVWMRDHWPRLQRISGLANHPKKANVEEFTREFWPEVQLE